LRKICFLGMAPAVIITRKFDIYYNMAAIPAPAFLDSLAAFALASLGLAFSLVAFLKISSIAWHNMFQALTRHWHSAGHFPRNLSRHRS